MSIAVQRNQVDRSIARSLRSGLVDVAWSDPRAKAALPPAIRATITGQHALPAVVVLGGISANATPLVDQDGKPGWWRSLFDASPSLATNFRIVGIDFAADPDGEFAPTPFDQAEAIPPALQYFGIAAPHAIIGASYGGMVALAYAARFQPQQTKLVILSADAQPHPTATAVRSLQRRIVDLGRRHDCAVEAVAIARGLAMVSYRSPAEFKTRFGCGIAEAHPLARSEAGDYLTARGKAFARSMSAGRFLSLSASIDRQDVQVGAIINDALIIGVEEDQVVPPAQLIDMASNWGGAATLHLFGSIYGHDAFLKDAPQFANLITEFLELRDK